MKASFFCNINKSTWSKNFLLKYTTEPFERLSTLPYHHKFWQVPLMVKELGDWGYNVDIMNDHDRTIRLTKQYDLIIDSFPQNRRIYENNLKRNCFKVFYSTDANPFWHNRQHELRVKALNLRRHARLQVKASLPPFNHELND